MQVLSQAKYLGKAANNFHLSNLMAAYEKDGEQSFVISIMAIARMPFIIDQFRIHTPNFNFRFTWVPLVFGGLTFVEPLLQKFLNFPNPTCVKEKISQATYQVLKITAKTSKFILQQSDKVFNTAYLINAVALMYLGFTVPGSIALFGLFTLAIKRYNFLPPTVERLITPIILASNLATTLATPMNIILRVIIVSFQVFNIIKYLFSKVINSILPESFTNPFYKKHVIEKGDVKIEEILENTSLSWYFKVNSTHFFSDQIAKIFPLELDKSFEKSQASELFDQLEKKMQTLGIELDHKEKKGLENLKTCAIYGRTSDINPTNIELLQKLINFFVYSIIKDDHKESFHTRVKEFASAGNSCTQGMIRDINYLACLQTENLEWLVHRILATMRGEIIKEEIRKYYQDSPVGVKITGGTNNIHVANAVQNAFWHRYRTLDGEINHQLSKTSIFNLLALKMAMSNKNTEKPSHFEQTMMCYIVSSGVPGLLSPTPKIENFVRSEMMDNKRIVNSIYDAILKKEIPPQVLYDWIRQIENKYNIEIMNLDNDEVEPTDKVSFPRFVGQNENQFYLTQEGVRLLLWDLGILTYNRDP